MCLPRVIPSWLVLFCVSSVSSLGAGPLPQVQILKHPPDVVEAYHVCETFERLMGQDLNFPKAFEATFVESKARRRSIAVADGEFGDLDFAKIDDELLINAYKLRMQLFYLMLPLAGPSDKEESIFFPPEIKTILKRNPPTDALEFGAYVSQLKRDVARFRAHLDQLAVRDPNVAERISKFKSEMLEARIEPPSDHKIEPSLGHIAAGVLAENEAHYEINNYLVAKEQGKMRIVGIRFFTRLF